MKATLCLVNESRYLPEAVEEEAAAEVDADALASAPFGVVVEGICCLTGFVRVFLEEAPVPLGRVDLPVATLAAAIMPVECDKCLEQGASFQTVLTTWTESRR